MSSPALVPRFRVRLGRADIIRLIASLILAVLLWAWVTNAQDPDETRQFSNVPVVVGELPAPLQVIGSVPDVTVSVKGPRSVISDMISGDVSASLDLSEIDQPGDYTVDIDIDAPGAVWHATSAPSHVPIKVEESITKQFVIESEVVGPIDSTRQINATIVDTSEATVVGPRSSVDRVARVIAQVTIEDQTQDFTASITPQAVDPDDAPIPEVEVSPETVRVHVAIDARGKQVAVLTQLEGTPAQGYEVVDRTINPATVLVDGPDAVIDQLISVSTEPIDITGATATVTRRVSVTGLPDDVQVLDPADGRVDVVIQIRQLGVTLPLPAQAVQVIGLSDGLDATLSPDAVTVTVVAPEAMLGDLTTSQLTVQVDVRGLGPGTYQLTPIVALPPNVTWIASDPATISVTITSTATPAPEVRASPSAKPL